MSDAEKYEVLYEACRDALDLLGSRDDTYYARVRLLDALKEVER